MLAWPRAILTKRGFQECRLGKLPPRLPRRLLNFSRQKMQFFGAYEQIGGFDNVSALAHLGGVSAGFVLWLLWCRI
jgi:hypothetical protein